MIPRVSVVLPFCNAEATLSRAIESIVCQTFPYWKLLLINHASTDDSVAIADRWCAQDQRITVLHEHRPGLVHALNTGLAHVRTQLTARMDADDVSHPERLIRQTEALRDESLAAVGCRVRYCATHPQPGMQAFVDWTNKQLTSSDIRRNRFVESPLVHPSMMFRTSVVKRYGAYRHGDFPEDYELWLRWLSHGLHIAKCADVLLDWYDKPTRLSRTHLRYRPEAFYQVKTEYLARWLAQHNPFHPRVVVWGGGRKSRQRVRLLEGHGIVVEAIIDVVPAKTSVYPCIFYQDLAPPGEYFILSYVGNRGRREEVSQFLLQREYQEEVDFLLVA